MERVRIDKWLWAARFFKTRALASRACELGRIEDNGQGVKASREVRPGDLLRIKNAGGEFHVKVLVVSDIRGPAAMAQTYYEETPESREARVKAAEERKAMTPFERLPDSKPTGRERRQLDRFRGRT